MQCEEAPASSLSMRASRTCDSVSPRSDSHLCQLQPFDEGQLLSFPCLFCHWCVRKLCGSSPGLRAQCKKRMPSRAERRPANANSSCSGSIRPHLLALLARLAAVPLCPGVGCPAPGAAVASMLPAARSLALLRSVPAVQLLPGLSSFSPASVQMARGQRTRLWS